MVRQATVKTGANRCIQANPESSLSSFSCVSSNQPGLGTAVCVQCMIGSCSPYNGRFVVLCDLCVYQQSALAETLVTVTASNV